MPLGPGKYGANAAALLKQHGGRMCVVIMDGTRGWGFDVATTNPELLRTLPAILHGLADDIAKQIPAEITRAEES